MILFQLIFVSLSIIYVLLVIVIIYGWEKLKTPLNSYDEESYTFPVSILLPVRNESLNLPFLLKSISQQTHKNHEVILIDDHSTDDTLAVAQSLDKKYQLDLKILHLEKLETGKKTAISKGIQKAKGKLIITTDADCSMGNNWVLSFTQQYLKEDSCLISGPVCIEPNSSWSSKLQTVEFSTLIGVGASSIAFHSPNMCNGANLAYPKSVFLEVGGYQDSLHIPSGDDIFLLEKIKSKYPNKISFLKSKEAIVYTKPAGSLYRFIQQRKRWASKWNISKSMLQTFIAIGVFLLYFTWMVALLFTLTHKISWVLFLTISFLKFMAEYVLLWRVLKFFDKTKLVPFTVLLYIMYPFYTLLIGFLVQFGKYEWKDRVN